MKNLGRKGTVHPSPATKPDDHFLSLLPVAILSLVAALSIEDREVLAYLISNSGDPNGISNLKEETPNEDDHHSPLFLCHCFSCYTSYWVRWDLSPNRKLIHQIIDAFEDSLELKKKKKKYRRKRSGKSSNRVNSVAPSRLNESNSSSPELAGGDSVEEAEKEKGSVEKFMTFVYQKFSGFWG